MPSTLQKILSPKMLVATCMGFASGLPLLLTKSTLQAWMTDAGVHLTVIGLFALVAIPYSFKFAWAPVFDRYVPPFLGRRRGWMLLTQVGLILCIAGLACTRPHDNAWLVALLAVIQIQFPAPLFSPDLHYLPEIHVPPAVAGIRALAALILLLAGIFAVMAATIGRSCVVASGLPADGRSGCCRHPYYDALPRTSHRRDPPTKYMAGVSASAGGISPA